MAPRTLSPIRGIGPRPKDLGLRTYLTAGRGSWYTVPMNITEHAKRQAATRGIDVAEVVSIVHERVPVREAQSYAVLVGYCEGWRGASNGDVVWAIVRGDALATVMFRRSDQPSVAGAFGVERVVA